MIIKRVFWLFIAVFALAVLYIMLYRPDDVVMGLKNDAIVAPASDKDPAPSDPNRPYYDACGNEFDYQGHLIKKGAGCQMIKPIIIKGFRGK